MDKMKCPHCGKEIDMAEEKDEGPEVEVSIEGDAKSIKEILSELIPERKK